MRMRFGTLDGTRVRLLLTLLVCLLVFGPALAEEVAGAVARAQTANRAPVVVGAYAQPSALPSPVSAGKVDFITTDGEGNAWVRVRSGSVTASLPAGSPLPVLVQPSPVIIAAGQPAANVTLPSASPVPVMINSYATATGYSCYCSPEFAGGVSEVTVKGSTGLLLGGSVSTNSTSDIYLLVWDASNPTPGTTAPTASFVIPAGTGGTRSAYDFWLPAPGLQCSTAITATLATASNGSTAPTGNQTVNLFYK